MPPGVGPAGDGHQYLVADRPSRRAGSGPVVPAPALNKCPVACFLTGQQRSGGNATVLLGRQPNLNHVVWCADRVGGVLDSPSVAQVRQCLAHRLRERQVSFLGDPYHGNPRYFGQCHKVDARDIWTDPRRKSSRILSRERCPEWIVDPQNRSICFGFMRRRRCSCGRRTGRRACVMLRRRRLAAIRPGCDIRPRRGGCRWAGRIVDTLFRRCGPRQLGASRRRSRRIGMTWSGVIRLDRDGPGFDSDFSRSGRLFRSDRWLADRGRQRGRQRGWQ